MVKEKENEYTEAFYLGLLDEEKIYSADRIQKWTPKFRQRLKCISLIF